MIPDPPNGDPFSSRAWGTLDVEEGAVDLRGPTQIPNSGGIENLLKLNLGVDGALNVEDGTTFKGTGILGASTPIIKSGGTLQPSTGLLTLLSAEGGSNIDFQQGSTLKTAITSDTLGTLLVFALEDPVLDLTRATLEFTTNSLPTDPTVYIVLFSGGSLITPFQNVLLNGGASPDGVIYSPPENPNTVLYPLNVPNGISSAKIVYGEQSLESVVLRDACTGDIIVVGILAPSDAEDIVQSFLRNSSILTNLAISNSTSALNDQISRKRSFSKSSDAKSSPVAAWHRAKNSIESEKGQSNSPYLLARASDADLEGVGEGSVDLPLLPSQPEKPLYAISLSSFAQFQQQDAIRTSKALFPSYDTTTLGFTLGFDYLGMERILAGGAATFVYTDLEQDKKLAEQDVSGFLGTLYSSFLVDQLSFNLLVTGGYNYNKGKRVIPEIAPETIVINEDIEVETTGLPGGIARSKYDTYQVVPHFDLNYEFGFDWISLVPFIQSDCAITFQTAFEEFDGPTITTPTCDIPTSLNTAVNCNVSFLLQNEAGFNLYEQVKMQDGASSIIFRQKGSYVNRYNVPFTFESKFVEEDSFTPLEVMLPMQHFFGSALEMIFQKKNTSIILSFENLVGSGYVFNMGLISWNRKF